MKAAASESFGYNEDQIVSSDVIGMRYGSLFDATQTMVTKIDDDTYHEFAKDRQKKPSLRLF